MEHNRPQLFGRGVVVCSSHFLLSCVFVLVSFSFFLFGGGGEGVGFRV